MRLARICRAARKLYSGSAFSAATWGHQSCGLSDSTVLPLERNALSSTGIKPEARCRTIALAVSFGVLGTPRARVIRETINEWCGILHKCEHTLIRDIRSA